MNPPLSIADTPLDFLDLSETLAVSGSSLKAASMTVYAFRDGIPASALRDARKAATDVLAALDKWEKEPR